MPQDPVADRLSTAPVPDAIKASAWDAYEQATDPDDLAKRLRALPLPDSVRADLWDLKSSAAPMAAPEPEVAEAPADERSWLDTAKDFGTGLLVQSVGGAIVNAGEAVHAIPGVSRAVDALYGTPGLSDAAFTEAQKAVTPTNAPMSAGKFVGDIAQVIVPGRAITAAGTKMAARATSAAGQLAARAGTEAAGGAVISGLQGGDPTTGAVLSGAIPVVGKVGGAVAGRLKAKVPEHVMKALGPTKEKYKAMAERITPGVVARRLGGSREQLQQQAAEAASEAGQKIDEALKTEFGGKVLNTQPVQEALEQTKRRYISIIRETIPEGAENAPRSFASQQATVDELFRDTLDDARRMGFKGSVSQLRSMFDDAVTDAKAFTDDMSDLDEPTRLLKAIAKNGGFGDDPGFKASIRKLWEDSSGMHVPSIRKTTKTGRLHKTRELPVGAVAGVPGVVRKGGKRVDAMVEALRADGIDIPNTTDLLRAVDDARSAIENRGASAVPLGKALQGVGLRPGTKWWDADSAGMPNVREKSIVLDPRAVKQIDKLQSVIAEHGPEMTVDQLVAVRRVWDDVVAQAGGYAQRAPGGIGVPLKDATEAWAKRKATTAIRQLLDAEVPELTALNKEFAFWKSLDDVLRQTLKRTAPQGPGLKSIAAEGAGRMAGAITSSGGAMATVGNIWVLGKLVKLADAAFSSPRWQFASARMKDDLADAIVSGKVDKAASVLARITAVQGSKIPAAVGAQ